MRLVPYPLRILVGGRTLCLLRLCIGSIIMAITGHMQHNHRLGVRGAGYWLFLASNVQIVTLFCILFTVIVLKVHSVANYGI